jgi:hypothetical protein
LKSFITNLLRISILAYAILHFTTVFWQNSFLELLLSISGFSLFILSFVYLGIRKFKLPIFILTLGIVILLISHNSLFEAIENGMRQMRSMVGFLIIMPLISFALREEPYIEDIMALFSKFIDTSKRFYVSIVFFTQIIAYFLLFSSIAMMHQFVNVILKKQASFIWEQYKATALLRGFALSTMWVLSIPSFIFAVETLGASLSITIIQGLAISILASIMSVIFAHFMEKRQEVDLTPELREAITEAVKNASPKDIRIKKVIEFSLLFVSLFGTVFLLHSLFNFRLMILIPIVIIFWVIAFYVLKGRINKLPDVFSKYVKYDLMNQSYQLNVMLSVGVLIFALNQTNLSNVVVDSIDYIQQTFPFINVLYLLPFIIIFLGFIGLGPLTVMVLVAGILESMSFSYPPELLVLALTSGSVISILISPIVMPVIILSASNGLSLYTNGIKFNWKFAITFYILVQIYLQTAVHLGFFT